MAGYNPTSGVYHASAARLYSDCDLAATSVSVDLYAPEFPPEEQGLTSWPSHVRVDYHLAPDSDSLTFTVWFEGKQANRRPEAFWLSFAPVAPELGGWRLDKLGQWVDPNDVIDDGGRHLHGVGRGVIYREQTDAISLETLDAHLVAPGRPALLQFDNEPLALDGGMHVNLYNNLWGTAFPQWCDQDMRFRFQIAISAEGTADS